MPDFSTIEYLRDGNPRQREAWKTLTGNRVMERLADFDPLLVGTIPISIDIDGSDLDIICRFDDPRSFSGILEREFGRFEGFTLRNTVGAGDECVVAAFFAERFEIEVFGQRMPSRQQNAWRHMLIENALLEKHGENFRCRVIELKKQGLKTEPAFARLLGVDAQDPYTALLEYGKSLI